MRVQLFQIENLSDEELISDAQGGSKEAIDTLVKRYLPLVNKRIRPYFLLGSEHEDLKQEALIGLYKAIKSYDINKGLRFKSFVDICITRSIITAIKKYCRQKHRPLNDSVSFHKIKVERLFCTKNIDPLKIILRKEAMGNFHAFLTGFERKVIKHFLSGFTYRQTALALRLPKKAVDNAMQRVRRKAKKHLKDYYLL